MATPESVAADSERAKQEEVLFKEELKKYLTDHPFPKEDYEKQKASYENLVEQVLRLREALSSVSGFVNSHRPFS